MKIIGPLKFVRAGVNCVLALNKLMLSRWIRIKVHAKSAKELSNRKRASFSKKITSGLIHTMTMNQTCTKHFVIYTVIYNVELILRIERLSRIYSRFISVVSSLPIRRKTQTPKTWRFLLKKWRSPQFVGRPQFQSWGSGSSNFSIPYQSDHPSPG